MTKGYKEWGGKGTIFTKLHVQHSTKLSDKAMEVLGRDKTFIYIYISPYIT